MNTLRSILGPSKYRFRLTRTSTLTSGAGTMSIPVSTNLTQYSEGAALAALFEECRMVSGILELQQATVGGLSGFSEMLGYFPGEDSSTPTLGVVQRCRYVTTFGTGNYVVYGYDNRLRWKTEGRQWGATADEGVSSPRIVSGFNGAWKYVVLAGTPSNTSTYFGTFARVIGEFRSRI